MITIENLSFAYKRRSPLVLDGFSLKLEHSGIYGLLGPNGVGKSTLLYLMTGMLFPTGGTVKFDGYDAGRRLPGVLERMFLVPEELVLPRMSAESYVNAYSCMYPNFSREIFDACLAEFMMPKVGRLDSLSMGQRKKVMISFAIAARTPLLLMDEPTNGLDIQGKAAFRSLVSRYISDDQIVVISTHQVRDLDQLLDHILIVNNQKVLLDSPVSKIQDKLSFYDNVTGDIVTRAMIALPSPGGFAVMGPNTDGDMTAINLELLFTYVLQHPEIKLL